MNDSDKLKAFGEISPEFIDSAAKLKKRRPLRAAIMTAAAIAAAVGAFFAVRAMLPKADDKTAAGETPAPAVTQQAELTEEAPEKTPAPTNPMDYLELFDPNATHAPESDRQKRLRENAVAPASVPAAPVSILSDDFYSYYHDVRTGAEGINKALEEFYEHATAEFLLLGDKGENAVCSPLNVYMALAMLAECTGGETQRQLLDLLGSESIEGLRDRAGKLFLLNYYDCDAMQSIPAASLWVNTQYGNALNRDALQRLSEDHHASVYSGDMGDPAFSALLREWLNESTGGMLEDQIGDIHFDPAEMMRIVSSLYFKSFWDYRFNESANTEELFHSPTGDETVTFMHGGGNLYYEYPGFTMVKKGLTSSNVWLVLPNEGTELEELVKSGSVMEAILSDSYDYAVDGAIIHLHMPKFDVSSRLDLKEGLMRMGVRDCFTAEADFSPLTSADGAFVTSVQHGVRVKVDEEGVSGAAYVMIPIAGAMPPQREVDFTLDRPFMFVITGADGTPLFAGTVYHPAG